jgi:hypothetical protein
MVAMSSCATTIARGPVTIVVRLSDEALHKLFYEPELVSE